MELISSLSTSQKENMESDFEENMFFRFNHKYPGYEFVCLEKLKICNYCSTHSKKTMIFFYLKIDGFFFAMLMKEDLCTVIQQG